MADELPNWVYDLVIGLEEQAEVHPKLFFTSGAFEGYAQYDWCACNALERVPEQVRHDADVIRRYREKVTDSDDSGLPASRGGAVAPAGDASDPDACASTGTNGGHGE